jgi:hypothetical protein
MMGTTDFNIGDLVTVRKTREIGVIVKRGKDYPGSSRYRSQFADIKWYDIEKPCRIYKCYGNWDVVEVVVRAKI